MERSRERPPWKNGGRGNKTALRRAHLPIRSNILVPKPSHSSSIAGISTFTQKGGAHRLILSSRSDAVTSTGLSLGHS